LGQNLKYKIILLLLLVFCFINFNIVHAFFLVNDHSNEIQIEHTIIDRSPQDNNIFQLHDNYLYSNTNSFILKRTKGFIFADQIEINIPLKILARDSIYPENSIDRLLLANLRVKKLILEYMELQKKTQFILQEKTMATARETNPKMIDNRGDKEVDNIEAEKEKINKKLFNIKRLSRTTQDDVLSNEAIFVADYSLLKNRTNTSLTTISYFSDFITRIDDNPDIDNADITAKQIFTNKKKNSLPWIFKVFLKILNYILNYRLEIILYSTAIVIVGYFIILHIRR